MSQDTSPFLAGDYKAEGLSPPVKYFTDRSKAVLLLGITCVILFMSCVCHAFASVHCCLVVTCWEKADL